MLCVYFVAVYSLHVLLAPQFKFIHTVHIIDGQYYISCFTQSIVFYRMKVVHFHAMHVIASKPYFSSVFPIILLHHWWLYRVSDYWSDKTTYKDIRKMSNVYEWLGFSFPFLSEHSPTLCWFLVLHNDKLNTGGNQ